MTSPAAKLHPHRAEVMRALERCDLEPELRAELLALVERALTAYARRSQATAASNGRRAEQQVAAVVAVTGALPIARGTRELVEQRFANLGDKALQPFGLKAMPGPQKIQATLNTLRELRAEGKPVLGAMFPGPFSAIRSTIATT